MSYDILTINSMGLKFRFLVNGSADLVQAAIRSGHFYESEELELISEFAHGSKYILDIGANVGNYSVYFAHRFNPVRTVPLEPNPRVVPLLCANIGLNWHPSFDLSLVGCGFPKEATGNSASTGSLGGLGIGGIQIGEDYGTPIFAADAVMPGATFDLIKIDAKPLEAAVVSGMSGILGRSKAYVFIDVQIRNINMVMNQLTELGYAYRASHQRYGRSINLLFEKTE